MRYNYTCPICEGFVHYWPNYSPHTSSDYGDVSWLIRGRGKFKEKLFFHTSCFRGTEKENEVIYRRIT